MQATRVAIKKCSTTTREYIAIVVHSHDLVFSCDLISARQLKLAHTLAQNNGIELDVQVDVSDLPTA